MKMCVYTVFLCYRYIVPVYDYISDCLRGVKHCLLKIVVFLNCGFGYVRRRVLEGVRMNHYDILRSVQVDKITIIIKKLI